MSTMMFLLLTTFFKKSDKNFPKNQKFSNFCISRGIENDSFGDDIQSTGSNSFGKMVHGNKSKTKVESCPKFDGNDTKTAF